MPVTRPSRRATRLRERYPNVFATARCHAERWKRVASGQPETNASQAAASSRGEASSVRIGGRATDGDRAASAPTAEVLHRAAEAVLEADPRGETEHLPGLLDRRLRVEHVPGAGRPELGIRLAADDASELVEQREE